MTGPAQPDRFAPEPAPSQAEPRLSLEQHEWIDRRCLAFEDQWLRGARPQVRDYLNPTSDPDATRTLFRELLLLDVSYRQKQNENPALTDYAEFLPEYQPLVSFVLARFAKPAPYVLQPGERVDRYRIERRLGAGGFGTAYLGYDDKLDRPVAIKVAHALPAETALPQAAETPTERQAEESRIAASLSHPGIVPVFDTGQLDDGTAYTVMQYIEGCTLRQRMNEAELSSEEVARLFIQIADAMGYAHQRGLIHRDLDPGNILLDAQSDPHVADFGLAIHESRQMEMAGEFAGSLPYMAPEQVRGETHRMDGRADIWAMGVMLYEALTGRLPFSGEHPEYVADEILHRTPKPLRQIRPEIPSTLERICLRCLAKEPADRFPTSFDLAKALRRWLTGQADWSRRRMLWLSTLGTAAAVGGWYFATREAAVYQARLDLLVWDARWMRLDEPGSMPLRSGDQLRLQMQLNEPAYPLLLWVDADSRATILHPSAATGHSDAPSQVLPRLARFAYPGPETERSWEARFERAGVESVILLVRRTPPRRFADLVTRTEQRLRDLPRVKPLSKPTAAWFEQGEHLLYRWHPDGHTRAAPQSRLLGTVRDPLVRLHREIHQRFADEFDLIQGVSFSVEP